MSKIKSKVFAASAALTLIGGAGAAGALSSATANAATPSCGSSCIDIFSKSFGTYHNPQFVMDVYKQGEHVGQKVILFREANSDPAEDFTVSEEGQVSDFYQAGLVSAALNLHYGCDLNLNTGKCSDGKTPAKTSLTDDYAFEVQYSPFGVDSGLCAGVAGTAAANEGVTLQPCGVTSKTVWVVDTEDSCLSNPLYKDELPVINGSDTNFSEPFVLTYPAAAYPTDATRPQLATVNLNGFSQTGNGLCGGSGLVTGVNSNQLWAAVAGVLP